MPIDTTLLAAELHEAYATRRADVVPPSARNIGFDLDAAYAVEAELVRLRRANGRTTVGRKVGYANKAVWRALKLETRVWARMYDDTVTMADGNNATVSLATMCSPKLEPEVVFKLRSPVANGADAAAILESVEWLALGFEIVDSIFTDWKFQPPDFVAAYGLHAALVVGEPRRVDAGTISELVERLPVCPLRLQRNGELVAEESGRNCLRSPALSLGELANAIARRADAEPLGAGEIVSTGTLTEPQSIVPGETWTATIEGLGLDALTLRTT